MRKTDHSSDRDCSTLNAASSVVDTAWQEFQRAPYVQLQLAVPFTRFPDLSFSEAQRRSSLGRSLLERIAALDLGRLPHDLALTIRLVKYRAHVWSREADWYWTVIDPLGVGMFGLFLPAAYCGGYLLNLLRRQFASLPLNEPTDADRYLSLVDDYARLVDQFTERTQGQAERGMRMPKAQVVQARVLLAGLKSGSRQQIASRAHQLNTAWAAEFTKALEELLATRVEPAFDRVRESLSDDYLKGAPDEVGVGQYPGGVELFGELAKLHTTLDLTPLQIHERGLQRLADIEHEMRAIEKSTGFRIEEAASTPEEIRSLFDRYIDRMEHRLDECFMNDARVPYRAAPLPKELEKAMTYGYYDPPKADRAEGVYFFNAASMSGRSLWRIAALTYHELVPGHHLQFCTQQQNRALHPFRRYSFVNAYSEGWAEYVAKLAGEMGLYETLQERYGWLMSEAFLTSRLVADTGMNVLGWSLERGREYMRAHSRLTESEICTETIRYSCDIPAQALAYKLGDAHIFALRERMQRALGARFTRKDFHSAILSPGALPLSDLEWHIEHEIKNLMERYAH